MKKTSTTSQTIAKTTSAISATSKIVACNCVGAPAGLPIKENQSEGLLGELLCPTPTGFEASRTSGCDGLAAVETADK